MRRELSQIREEYKQRHAHFAACATRFYEQGRRIENFRGLTFGIAFIGLIVYFTQGIVIAGAVGGTGLFGFGWLVVTHRRVLEKESHARRFALVNEHGLKRCEGNWHDLPRAGTNFAPKNHEYADDLDLFGVASLYQRLAVAHTRFGQQTLASWIASPAPLGEIHARQKAVLELAGETELRQRVEAEGMALVEKRAGESAQLTDGPNPARLLAWVKEPQRLQTVMWSSLSVLGPLAVLATIFGMSWYDLPGWAWAIPVLGNVLLLKAASPATSDAFAAVSTTEGAFLRYGALLEILEQHQPKCAWLREKHDSLLSEQGDLPSTVMRRFRRIVSWYDLRHNGMAYPFINALLLWDIHCTIALEKWKTSAGHNLDRWFDAIGKYEALSSLAGLYADDPDASLPEVLGPEIQDGALVAQAVGHPLLSAAQRVKNDVTEFGPGQALLITGSNMSGKSTFLRTLGVNAVLAFMGGPVIARTFSVPLCKLGTSIRISDSLRTGVSHFYAEVQRLAAIVEHASHSDLPVLFLLDEVLHGTNSRERQIGARWVLAELLRHRAFGIVTTHDMELCRLPEALMASVRQHHFREIEAGGEMSFDYLLRSGPVLSGNALRLMRRVGLAVPLEDTMASSPPLEG